jgi:RNA polymerase sigma-70 factor (ECF subfamily)
VAGVNDDDFLKRISEGDNLAFKELFVLYKDKVLQICYRFILNQEDAEEVMQDVFLEVHRSISSFRGDASFSTWLYRIATTKSLDELKRQNRKKRIHLIKKSLGLDTLFNTASENPTPDSILETKESIKKIKQALDSLPEQQRIAITLSKIDGASNAMVAEIMGITTFAADSLIYRAKKNLIKYFENKSPIKK